MLFPFLADAVVIIHLWFVTFALLGGFLMIWWNRIAWIHIPAVLWAATVELMGWTCPLTPLENWLRTKGGLPGYGSSFVEEYIVPLLYPGGLTRRTQLILGAAVLAVNLGIYSWIYSKREQTS